jgi:hypothetical protein
MYAPPYTMWGQYLESFERICKSLALDTNVGRLIMIYLYAEELKEILPEKAV